MRISLVGVILAAFNYLDKGDGIAYSPGALLVLVATALILGASIVMMLDRVRTTWLAALLAALIILGAIGAALAAYFLDAYWLMALMIVGLLACLNSSCLQRKPSGNRRACGPAGVALMTGRFLLATILSAGLSASGALAQSQIAPVQSTAPAPPQSTPAATGGEAANRTPANPTPTANDERGPDKWMSSDVWATFNGDLKAQKYSVATQITPDNVGKLKKAWETHTGDVSAGGDKPMTVWSATPLFVNNTVYLGTPFYRILALEPDSGKVKWTFNPHATLKALTQPDLKNRGVAYWQAEDPQSGKACEKIVYIGTMDAKLYGVDADTGKPCPNFGKNGMVDVNQWNTANDKWPLSLLQPPTVYHDTLFLGWAGKDWTDPPLRQARCSRSTPAPAPSNGRSTPSLPRRPPRPERRMSGPPCRSTRRPDFCTYP